MTLAPEQELENPLLEGLGLARTPESCALVIFGASGDLTHKKLFPALYSLAFRQLLPRNFAVLGVARTEGSDEEFREDMKAAVQEHGRDPFREDIWETLAEGMQLPGHGLRATTPAGSRLRGRSRTWTRTSGRAATASTTSPSRRP